MIDVIWREDDGLHWDWSQLYDDCWNLLGKAQTKEELNQIHTVFLGAVYEAYEVLFKSFS